MGVLEGGLEWLKMWGRAFDLASVRGLVSTNGIVMMASNLLAYQKYFPIRR